MRLSFLSNLLAFPLAAAIPPGEFKGRDRHLQPRGLSCGVRGYDKGNPQAYSFSTRKAHGSQSGCATKCEKSRKCQSYAFGAGACLLYMATTSAANVKDVSSSPYLFFDRGCNTDPSPSADISTEGSKSMTCGQKGYDRSNPVAFEDSHTETDTTLKGCKTLCSSTRGCQSFALGHGVCLLYRSSVIGNLALDSDSEFTFYDLTCSIPISPTKSDVSTKTTSRNVQHGSTTKRSQSEPMHRPTRYQSEFHSDPQGHSHPSSQHQSKTNTKTTSASSRSLRTLNSFTSTVQSPAKSGSTTVVSNQNPSSPAITGSDVPGSSVAVSSRAVTVLSASDSASPAMPVFASSRFSGPVSALPTSGGVIASVSGSSLDLGYHTVLPDNATRPRSSSTSSDASWILTLTSISTALSSDLVTPSGNAVSSAIHSSLSGTRLASVNTPSSSFPDASTTIGLASLASHFSSAFIDHSSSTTKTDVVSSISTDSSTVFPGQGTNIVSSSITPLHSLSALSTTTSIEFEPSTRYDSVTVSATTGTIGSALPSDNAVTSVVSSLTPSVTPSSYISSVEPSSQAILGSMRTSLHSEALTTLSTTSPFASQSTIRASSLATFSRSVMTTLSTSSVELSTAPPSSVPFSFSSSLDSLSSAFMIRTGSMATESSDASILPSTSSSTIARPSSLSASSSATTVGDFTPSTVASAVHSSESAFMPSYTTIEFLSTSGIAAESASNSKVSSTASPGDYTFNWAGTSSGSSYVTAATSNPVSTSSGDILGPSSSTPPDSSTVHESTSTSVITSSESSLVASVTTIFASTSSAALASPSSSPGFDIRSPPASDALIFLDFDTGSRNWSGWTTNAVADVVRPGYYSDRGGSLSGSGYLFVYTPADTIRGHLYRFKATVKINSSLCYGLFTHTDGTPFGMFCRQGVRNYVADIPSDEWIVVEASHLATVTRDIWGLDWSCIKNSNGSNPTILVDNISLEPVSSREFNLTGPATGENILNDPGFESGGLSSYPDSRVTAATSVFQVVNTTSNESGIYGLATNFTALSSYTMRYAYLIQPVTLEVGAVYRASVDFRVTKKNACSMQLGVTSRDYFTTNTYKYLTSYLNLGNQALNTWLTQTVFFAAPLADMQFLVVVRCYVLDEYVMHMDNLSLSLESY